MIAERLLLVSCFVLLADTSTISGVPDAPKPPKAPGVSVGKPFVVGGQSQTKPGDEDSQQVANSVRANIEQQLGANAISEFVVESYKTQVVAGINYFLKIRHAPGKYIHARVFKPLPHTKKPAQLVAVQSGKSQGEDLAFF